MKVVISLLKKFKKKSTKAKVGIIVFIVIMIALIGYVLYSTFKPDPPVAYEMTEVSYGTITDCLDVSGTVESGITENFMAVEGVTVEEVLVSVGDRVKEGDKLATFNVSAATQYLNSAKKDYDSALKDYNEAKKSSEANANRKTELTSEINRVNSEIKALEKEIEELEYEIENQEPVTEMTTLPQDQIYAVIVQMQKSGATDEEIKEFYESAKSTQIPVTKNDTAKQELLMKKNLELARLNSELSSLQAENAVTVSTDNTSMLETLKTVADAKKSTYESVKEIYDSMKDGWYAENDGIVTTVNLKAGEKFVPAADDDTSIDISALLGSSVSSESANLISSLMGASDIPSGIGITVESYEDMIVNVTVGKSDLLKIKVGMEATVTSLDSTYDAEVVYVSATATDSGNSLDIGSIAGSLMGNSGANSAVVKVKIKNPDEKVVIGFDVDIKIKLSTVENVLKVPVECVIYDGGNYFVFVFDEEEGTAAKRQVEKGTLDERSYEIVSGLKEGEIVLNSPDPMTADGTSVQKKDA